MVEQIIEFEIKDNDSSLGVLSIVSEAWDNELLGLKPKSIKNMKFNHIRRDFNLDAHTPIQYCNLSNYATNIFLLEETEYTFSFIADKGIDKDKLKAFKFLKNHSHGKSEFKFKNFDNYWIVDANFRGFAGKTFIDIYYGDFKFSKMIEIRTKKLDYENEYSEMIADLSKISSGLIFNINSSLYQNYLFSTDIKSTLYESYMLLEYLFRPKNLPAVFEYLSRNLYSLLENTKESVPTPFASNIGRNEIAELSSNPQNIIEIDEEYSIFQNDEGKHFIPLMINEIRYKDTIDVPENRFFKYFLEFIRDLIIKLYDASGENQIKYNLKNYYNVINSYLSHRYFNEISRLDFIPLNSQVLQKKEGYREILEFYLMFEFGLRIKFGDLTDQFRGFGKELGKTYEIWSYFQLIDIVNDITNSQYDFNTFVKETNNKWSLSLGNINELNHFNSIVVDGQKVNLTLMYEKGFSRPEKYDPDKFSSYSSYLNPDYTLAIECNNIKKLLHFDAKYRLDENGSYKEPDIHKMHTYKDGINNTIGAYILFPGEKIKSNKEKEEKISEIFNEIDGSFGSVGAFCLKPGQSQKYKREIKNTINNIISESIKKGIFTYEFESKDS